MFLIFLSSKTRFFISVRHFLLVAQKRKVQLLEVAELSELAELRVCRCVLGAGEWWLCLSWVLLQRKIVGDEVDCSLLICSVSFFTWLPN